MTNPVTSKSREAFLQAVRRFEAAVRTEESTDPQDSDTPERTELDAAREDLLSFAPPPEPLLLETLYVIQRSSSQVVAVIRGETTDAVEAFANANYAKDCYCSSYGRMWTLAVDKQTVQHNLPTTKG